MNTIAKSVSIMQVNGDFMYEIISLGRLWMPRLIFKRKNSVLAAVELEMGLPGHHFVEIKSAQVDVEQGKHLTPQDFL